MKIFMQNKKGVVFCRIVFSVLTAFCCLFVACSSEDEDLKISSSSMRSSNADESTDSSESIDAVQSASSSESAGSSSVQSASSSESAGSDAVQSASSSESAGSDAAQSANSGESAGASSVQFANSSEPAGSSSVQSVIISSTEGQPGNQAPILCFPGADFNDTFVAGKAVGAQIPLNGGSWAAGSPGLKFASDAKLPALSDSTHHMYAKYTVAASGAQTSNGTIWTSPNLVSNEGRDYYTFWIKGSGSKDILFHFGAVSGNPSRTKPLFKPNLNGSASVFSGGNWVQATTAVEASATGWYCNEGTSGGPMGAQYTANFNYPNWTKIKVKLPNGGSGAVFDGCGVGGPLQIRTGNNAAYDFCLDLFQYEDSRHPDFGDVPSGGTDSSVPSISSIASSVSSAGSISSVNSMEYGSASSTHSVSSASSVSSTPSYPWPSTGVTQLTVDVWANGSLATGKEQWFRFTATASTQYIHAAFGTLNSWSGGVYIQVYNENGVLAGDQSRLNISTAHITRALTPGQVYYIRASLYSSSYSGTYQIAFNTFLLPPGAAVTPLAENTFASGSLASGGAQWFSFTATAAAQYVHAAFGTLSVLIIQIYDSVGNAAGSQSNLFDNTQYVSRTLISGQLYYIRVWPYSSNIGTYQIGFNASILPPGVFFPPASAAALTKNTLASSSLASSETQWFIFTANSSTQYIHADFGTLTGLYIQVYNTAGNTVGDPSSLSGSTRYISRALTSGQTYYIRIWSGNSGTYKIGFSAFSFSPDASVQLVENTFTTGKLIHADDAQWYSFTATAATQYFHAESVHDTIGVNIRVYTDVGAAAGGESLLYRGSTYATRTLTIGQTYYIQVRQNNSSYIQTYQIGFNAAIFPPGVSTLTQYIFANGSLASGVVQWHSFTATAAAQYIHTAFGTLNSSYGVYIQVYSGSGASVGSESRLYDSTTCDARALTPGQVYYIRVSQYNSSYGGTYRIAFSDLDILPSSGEMLTENTWTEGSFSAGSFQWYRFIATASTQYIFASGSGNMQVYTTTGAAVETPSSIDAFPFPGSRLSLVIGQEYYIRVWFSWAASYKITFSISPITPGATVLTANVWAYGVTNLDVRTRTWYSFTATASTQYIHCRNMNYSGYCNVQVYDSAGIAISERYGVSPESSVHIPITAAVGQEYFVCMQPYSGASQGVLYGVTFNTSSTMP
ncbi:MAG: hypothetical protein LBC99_05795 [Spirochaetota bacterium]|jgi:hypothetical protein|nr:hypothetical protein [Spirochaetota bacterium]